MRHYGDITKLNGADLPAVDCVIGGSPCVDISRASYERLGIAGERSGLFMEQIRIIKEMREEDKRKNGRNDQNCRPRYMVWENVNSALDSPGRGNKGKDFQVVLTETIRIVEPEAPIVPLPNKGEWPNAGCLYSEMGEWSLAWRVCDSQFWGSAQRRKRIALIVDFGGLTAPDLLFERDVLPWDSEESESERESTSAGIREGSDETSEPVLIEMTSTKNTIVTDGICPTLTARMGTGGNQVNAVCVGNGQLHQMSMLEVANTLDTMHDQQAIMTDQTGDMVVRRLTPMECERLQGLPDGWTDIGEWIDSKGRRRKSADSLRYKALGNTIAVGYTNNASGFWMWLIKRISAQYSRNATMASLFDGIGAFPLAWEYYNGNGSAVWSSEIDEFATAVSKFHFPDNGSIQ